MNNGITNVYNINACGQWYKQLCTSLFHKLAIFFECTFNFAETKVYQLLTNNRITELQIFITLMPGVNVINIL